ncbi:hypothetical protein H6G25_16715 [Dolichospermum sp. FACHB-1091]|uniref:hypothetical protein n=1 Tax=Dolichospermum sp. FACHB-1091 TaxID=2692798 RepID=UPI0016813DC2|nr:hypothetical protein [Dolichospermum sp. FACHB-1091]MBD2444795.1 hypothetical protein [Dolichospermum sp. FACHB-1091]
MDTYHRNCQLGASRRRLEDAETLHKQKRWTGAIYLGGYAVECALKSLICYEQRKNHFKETTVFQKIQGASLHNLTNLLNELEYTKKSIQLDRSNILLPAWKLVSSMWLNDELRYSDKLGDEKDSKEFIAAVKILHTFFLAKQNETS